MKRNKYCCPVCEMGKVNLAGALLAASIEGYQTDESYSLTGG